VVLKEVINILEKEFPSSVAESWDNVGHILGYKDDIINKVQVSLDLTENVINKAIETGVDLIITHHPPIFKPIQKINDGSIIGKKILKLIRHGINVYTLHTNLDGAKNGLNQYVAEKLQGKNIKIMEEIKEELFKIEIRIRKDMKNINFEKLANSENLVVLEDEYFLKINCIGNKNYINSIRSKLDKEVEFNIIKLENKKNTQEGIGRIFEIEGDYNIESYVDKIKTIFDLDYLKMVKSNSKPIKKVAIVNGSGVSFWKKALKLNADLFITGDLKYHDALDAFEAGLNIVDIGHYESEHFFNELIIKKLNDKVEVKVYNERRIFEIR
jgi:dinuclear metal center YbgI/SA1388 family protein